MKKLFIIFTFAVVCAGVMFGQQKVAVYIAGGQDAGISKVLGDKLVEAFVKSGKYTAIERTNNFLAELGKEQNYQQTGAVNDNEISRLGKQFGVQFVCVAEMSDVFGEKYISARLIDVETAEVVTTSNASSPLKNIDQLLYVADKISKELAGKTGKEQNAENERLKIQEQQRIANEKAAEQDRIARERAIEQARIARENEEAKQRQQEQQMAELGAALGASIVGLVDAVNSGTITLINKDKDPFYIYLDGEYKGVINGNSTVRLQVNQGNHTLKVVEKSGYIVQQVEKWTFYLNKKENKIFTWD